MNGIHDMGGMQDMGPIRRESHEPVFHDSWEGRVYALSRVLRARGTGVWNLDAFRHGIEVLPPTEYLRMTYYERWFAWMLGALVASGDATASEIETGQPTPGSPKAALLMTAETARSTVERRGSARRDVASASRFKVGQRVRARNMHPAGHTRLPRYARGKIGIVARDRGVHVFPDAHAHQLGEKPQHLYSVTFTARELWGEQAVARDAVHIDMWDEYLEHA
jgi:nitrile hydratase